ncbi:MAG TPA: hypothetical protein VKT31_13715 [Solirubrobacteraceae bacterium]|nr:hypothetical protein [Solirubrobacteraceae bacterium]
MLSAAQLLHGTRRVTIAEHHRLPYAVLDGPSATDCDYLAAPRGAKLLWPARSSHEPAPSFAILETADGRSIPIFAAIATDEELAQLRARHGDGWQPAAALTSPGGTRLASVWRAGDGSLCVPFDPDEVCEAYWSERYLQLLAGSRLAFNRLLMHAYYGVRRGLPRTVQIWLRRRYARVQARTAFPAWPVETALHDFFELFLSWIDEVAGHAVPRIGAWPAPHQWALVLTHDVETAEGVAAIEPVLELERSLGLRSSWNFVVDRYALDDALISELLQDGFEVGVHGVRHDGRDLRSVGELRRRLPALREAAERWDAVGFRSPAMHRNWDWMPLLGFDYDASYPDSDPFEPQAGGCCTWLPFFNRDTLELPVTMAQDHTLFEILRHDDASVWIEKARFLKARGGMAQVLTHPDYLVKPRVMDAYRRLLETLAGDESVWKALPREVNAWWRRRAQTEIVNGHLAGPAAGEAQRHYGA